MASIQAGLYTVEEIFQKASFDFAAKAAADYLDGAPDFRRVQVGGLGFDDLDKKLVVPYTADELVITVDGEVDTTLKVTLTDEQKEQRAASFESAADTNDSK